MKMLTLISPTGPHSLNEYVPTSMVPAHDTHMFQQIMSQGYEPEPPVNDYVNPQFLQPNGFIWGEAPGYSMPNQ